MNPVETKDYSHSYSQHQVPALSWCLHSIWWPLYLWRKAIQMYNVECKINDKDINITRKSYTKFWIGVLYDSNGTYKGLVLSQSCPRGYCKETEVSFSVGIGTLCGACATNHSLLFGNSYKCQNCSNIYLLLLLAFTGAGVALVVFLSCLRLTVASGMINSVTLSRWTEVSSFLTPLTLFSMFS